MRLSSLLSLLGAAVLVTAGDEKEPGPTVFNGISVPPMLELTPKNFNKEIVGTKWMLVKHYR